MAAPSMLLQLPSPPTKLDELCDKGDQLFNAHRVHQAGRYFLRALNLDKDYGRASTGLARCVDELCNKGRTVSDSDYDKAIRHFDQALSLDPCAARALAGRSFCLRSQGDYDSAEHVINRGLYSHPHNEELLQEQAYLYFDQEQWDQAANNLASLLKTNPLNHTAWVFQVRALKECSSYEAVKQAVEAALQRFPRDSDILTEWIGALIDQGLYDPAVVNFTECYGNKWVKELVKRCLRPPWQKANGFLEAALARNPGNLDLLSANGRVLWFQKRGSEALEVFDKLLSIKADHDLAHRYKMIILRRQRRFQDAQAAFEEAVKKVSSSERKRVFIEHAFLLYVQKQYDGAVEAFLQAGPETLENILGNRDQPRYRRELEDDLEFSCLLDAALRRLPQSSTLHAARGKLLAQAQPQNALSEFGQALSLDSHNQQAFLGKIRCLHALNLPEAVALLDNKAAILVNDDDVSGDLLKEAVLVYCDARQYEDAVSLLNRSGESGLVDAIEDLRQEQRQDACEHLTDEGLRQAQEENQRAALLRCRGYLDLDRQLYKAALEAFESSLTLDPVNPDAQFEKCVILRSLQRFDEADSAVRHALSLVPTAQHTYLLNEKGKILYDKGEFKKAVDAFDEALRLTTDDQDALQMKVRSLRRILVARADKPDSLIQQIEETLLRLPEEVRLWEEGLYLNDQGRFKEAESFFHKAQQLSPGPPAADADTDWYFGYADALRELDKEHEAIDLLSSLKSSRPHDAAISEGLGWLYLAIGSFEQARREFECILESDPNNALGLNGLGGVYYENEQYELAEEHFKKALKPSTMDSMVLANQGWALIMQVPDWFSVHPESDKPRSRYESLATARRRSSWLDCLRTAEKCCRKALDKDPRCGSACHCLGLIAYRNRDLPQAEEYLKQAIDLNPRDCSGHADLGALYIQMERHEEAEIYLKKASDLDHQDARPYVELGNLYFHTEKVKQALCSYRKAVSLDKKNGEAACQLALALMEAGRFEEAEKTLREAVLNAEESKSWKLHLTLARFFTALGDKAALQNKTLASQTYKKALREATDAITGAPQRPEPYFCAGVVRSRVEDFHGAIKSFSDCLEWNPDHLDAEKNIALLEPMLRQEMVRTLSAQFGLAMMAICLVLLTILWRSFFTSHGQLVDKTLLTTLTPILLGLSTVALLLPRLVQLTLPGVKADLSQPKPEASRESIGVGFGTDSISAGPSGSTRRRVGTRTGEKARETKDRAEFDTDSE